MKVLQLVTTRRPFYEKQIEVLERKGVETTTVRVPRGSSSVPGRHDERDQRSVYNYLQFYPKVLKKSLDSYDIVHANYGLTAPFALAQPRRPLVLTLWGSDVLGEYGWLTKRCARHFDAVTVRSKEMQEELPTESHLMPSGIDMQVFKPMDQSEALEQVGWDPDAKHVLFPYSPTYERKNYPLAERVVEEVDSRLDRDVTLQAVYGVEHEDMAVYMNAADVMILASGHEGSPNTVKEALACNTPVVSTDVGDVKERVKNVRNSIVCDSQKELIDGLLSVFESGKRSNGRSKVEAVSLERMGDQIIDIYASILNS